MDKHTPTPKEPNMVSKKKVSTKREKMLTVIVAALDVFFKGNFIKTDTWLRSKNNLLGGIRPWDMIEVGREKKLLKFINTQLSQNPPKKKSGGGA